jgi:biopolymer transport protein ExbB
LLFFACLAVLLFWGSFEGTAPRAVAQEEGGGEKAAEGGAEKAAPAPPKKGHGFFLMIKHIIVSLGWFLPVLLIVSIALMALIVLLTMELRMGPSIPPTFVEDFTDTVNKRRFKEAYEMAKEDGSFLARVLTAGMSRLQYGIEDAREAAFSAVDSIRAGKEQFITYLATIGTLGPLLGLVGTVWGMIGAFMTLKESSSGANAAGLADDISHALAVTLVGIGLSVPAIFFHAFFRNRLVRIAHDVTNVADDLLTQMYHNSKKPAVDVDTRGVATAAVKPK